MKVDFAITFCCEELQIAMVKREWWFSIATTTGKVVLLDEHDKLWRHTCPFCCRQMEDMVDVDIVGVDTESLV